jgi:hypothetical protein
MTLRKTAVNKKSGKEKRREKRKVIQNGKSQERISKA